MVTNQCDVPIYVWSVGGEWSDHTTLSKDSTYGELYEDGRFSDGKALIVATSLDGPFTPNAGHVVFDYNIDNAFVHYDLGSLFLEGVADRRIKIQTK